MDCKLVAGQRVVFVGFPSEYAECVGYDLPQKNKVFTIAEVVPVDRGEILYDGIGHFRAARSAVAIRLVEDRPEIFWNSVGFRPVDETRIDCFRQHLSLRGQDWRKLLTV